MNKIRTSYDRDRLVLALQPVDEAFRQSEAKWGVGQARAPRHPGNPGQLSTRLDGIPPSHHRRRRIGHRRPRPQDDPGALAFMDREATALGHQPLSVTAGEAAGERMDASSVVVRTQAEAHALARAPDGRETVVYSVEEIAPAAAGTRCRQYRQGKFSWRRGRQPVRRPNVGRARLGLGDTRSVRGRPARRVHAMRTWPIDHLDGWRTDLEEHPDGIDIIVAGNSRVWRALRTDIEEAIALRLAHHRRTAPHRMPDRSGVAGVRATPPVFIPLWCACKACGHRWDDWQPSYVPVATWAAHAKTIRCPQCGARAA